MANVGSIPPVDTSTLSRTHAIAMIRALAARASLDPEFDLQSGLGALVLRAQGDEDQYDDAQRALVPVLMADVINQMIRR